MRRLAATGLRWPAGHPGRRVLVTVAGLACLAGLASFRVLRGRFRGWQARPRRAARRDGPGYLGWKRIPPSKRMTSAFM